MAGSEYDSALLDKCRRKNDNLLAENDRLRSEIARLVRKSSKLYWAIRELMEK